MKAIGPAGAATTDIDAGEFANIVGGRWEIPPPDTWRFRGLCYSRSRYRPGQMILGQTKGFLYGVDLSTLTDDMAHAGLVLSRDCNLPQDLNPPILRIDSVHRAVRRLARHLRAAVETPIVAFTGSVGKTSSCHLARYLLAHEGRVSTNGQDNFADGILCETANLGIVDCLVIEACLQGLGEATAILKPHVAVLTHISPAHMELHESLAALAEAKAELFRHLAPHGTAVINRDIPYFERVRTIAEQTAANIVTFGEHPEADLRLMDYAIATQTIDARIFGGQVSYRLGVPGRHMAINSLGVLAAAHALGVNWRPLLARSATVRPVAGRGGVLRLKVAGKCITIIDDSWNASPASMAASFTTLANTPPQANGRRIAVLADMLELGANSPRYHRQLANPLIQSGADKVYVAGDMMANLWTALPPEFQGANAPSARDLLWPLVQDLRNGDVVLLKGSHDTKMHRLSADLLSLTIAPGIGLPIYRALATSALRIEPHLPGHVRTWSAWQFKKLIQRRTRAREALTNPDDI